MEYEYAIMGSNIFRAKSIINVLGEEYLNKTHNTWTKVTNEQLDRGFYPIIINQVDEQEALNKAIELGISKEAFYGSGK